MKDNQCTTHGIKHWGLGGYASILPRIKFGVTGQESSPQSPTISYRQTLAAIISNMKNKILLSLIILLSISCSNKTNTFKSIQFMSYYYSRYDQKTREICEIHIKCNLYVEINEEGKAFVYRKQYYPIESTLFGEYKLNKSFIDSLLMAAKSYIEPKRDTIARIYDGPSLKFTFNYPDCSSNSIGFIDVEKAEYLPFLRLYHYLDSTLIKENLREPQFDTVNFKEQIVDFIDYTMHMDTLEYPFPPMPPKEQLKVVKYVLPDSAE